jgi:hypothetical protein
MIYIRPWMLTEPIPEVEQSLTEVNWSYYGEVTV